jgi:hypothetical protein
MGFAGKLSGGEWETALKTGDRGQIAGDRGQRTKDRGQRTEVDPQITQITRIRREGTEGRGHPGEMRYACHCREFHWVKKIRR